MALPPPHLKARKRFGQNFLVDEYIIGAIVDAINPQPGQYLVEIGPGHAALTRPVLERAGSLTAIELDRDLAEMLRHDPFLKGLTLIEADALKVDFGTLPGAAEGKLRVFGNLPYNITSPLLFHLLQFTCWSSQASRTCTSCSKRKWWSVWQQAPTARITAVLP